MATLQALYRNHEYNKVLTTATASKMLLKIAFERTIESTSMEKLIVAAKKMQQQHVTRTRGKVDTTMTLRRLHVHV